MSDIKVSRIYAEASNLSIADQLELISKLATSLRKATANKGHKLSELQGLGKELWGKIDSEKYLKNLRQEWDAR